MVVGRNSEILSRLSQQLHRAFPNQQQMLNDTLAAVGEIAGVECGCAMMFADAQTVESVSLLGDVGDSERELWAQLNERGLTGFVYHSQRTVVIRNIATDPRWPLHGEMGMPTAGAAIGLPLQRGRHVPGVIVLLHHEVDYFTNARVKSLETLCDLAAAALGNALDFNTMRSSDRRYQYLFDDAVVPMLLTDLNGQIIDANYLACDLLRSSRHELLHQSIFTVHADEGDTARISWSDVQPGEQRTFRATAVRRRGAEIPVIVRLRLMQLDGREVIEWVEQDATAQMELEQLRRDLTAMVYHDLRGPLQSAHASLQKLGQVLANHDSMAVLNLLQTGIRSTRQLKRMVDSLLDIQRLEEGRKMLDRQPVELREMLGEAVQLVQPLAIDAGQHLTFDLDGLLPSVLLDRDMIVRVLTNLIENAIKYTPVGGKIIVRAQNRGDHARVSVVDTGPGIPQDMQVKIFDKFNRVKYQNAPKGVGLGLAFCRLAIRAHEGDIWVQSEGGAGSEFVFTLPVDTAPLTPDLPNGTHNKSKVTV